MKQREKKSRMEFSASNIMEAMTLALHHPIASQSRYRLELGGINKAPASQADRSSYHCYVSVRIKTDHTVPDISFSRKIYLKSQADCDGILNDFRELDWPDIYRQVDFFASMNEGFERIIVRRISSRVVKFCIKDKAWFNEDCRWANLAKQKAYQLWRRNRSDITWNNYVNLRNAAQETYAAAEKEYNDCVRDLLEQQILINGGLH